jgi:hypothetical protein
MTLGALTTLARGLRGFLGFGAELAAAAELEDEPTITTGAFGSFVVRLRTTALRRFRGLVLLLDDPLLPLLLDDLLLPLLPLEVSESDPLPLPRLLRLRDDEPLLLPLSDSLPDDEHEDDDSESL